VPPPTTMLGALVRYLHDADPRHFQPMNANFGLLAPLDGDDSGGRSRVRGADRKAQLVERARADFAAWTAAL